MSSTPTPSTLDKLGIVVVLVRSLFTATCHLLTTPLRSGPRPDTLYKDVIYTMTRTMLSLTSIHQDKWMNPATEARYLELAQKEGFKPDSLTLTDCKAHWIGSKSAKTVIVFFHGGGYVLPASAGHLKWLHDLTKDLAKNHSVASIVLGYTCAPEGQYPVQLRQAAELLHVLVEKEGRNPSDIILVGDSAGGNITMSLLSHLLHPNPDVPTKVNLNRPLHSAILISPWVDFDVNQPSFYKNYNTDMIPKEVGSRWPQAFLGNAKLDNYNQPVLANDLWFKDIESVVKDVLIWGGGGEVIITSIDKFSKQFQRLHPKVQYIVEPGACHESMIFDKTIGIEKKAQGTQVIEDWIASRL